ncbi:MAG: 1-deoxy-D-xylulose-5-phosphate reductoisomerase [Desulfuromonadales bacterium]|nr:1-deoxy-D-xylulose-5-phosphate reductoisomerase [Desulfuromonadales bacterium]
MKRLSLLGSTGSIGVSCLEVVADFPERFEIVALTGANNLSLLAAQIQRFRPQVAAVLNEADASTLRQMVCGTSTEILFGMEGLMICAAHADTQMTLSAIVGAAGLVPTMAAIEAGKDVALANKETLVTAGALVMEAVARKGVRLYPVDSEHSALFQSLEGHRSHDVRRLILTASGGPFRTWSLAQMENVTPAHALAHPNWSMGRKISIDSATMMNKGLEVIEAHWLFAVPIDRINVQIHPQSIVHSMVEYCDGAVIAQLGVPDMKTPIAYALSYPERIPLKLPSLDLCSIGSLTFEEPDLQRFPCLKLAYDAIAAGGIAPAVLNAANEIAVEAFLASKIPFLAIAKIIETVLDRHDPQIPVHLDDILHADRFARTEARRLIATDWAGGTKVC